MTIGAASLRVLGDWPLTAALTVALGNPAISATSATAQVIVSSEVQGALYPQDPAHRPAGDADVRGSTAIAFDRALSRNFQFDGNLVIYGSNSRRALVDGEATLAWRGADLEVAAGLMRERWGRFTNSPLDVLGPLNTPFSLVEPEQRLSQPTIRATAFLDRKSIDLYALTGGRRQPLPESDGRFGFGVATRDVVRHGALGDAALAVRLSGAELDVDWSAHVFGGLSRRPTFVPRFVPDAGVTGVDSTYTEILQVGGELETTRRDWRFLAEGFARVGALDVTGRERPYGYMAGAAEYQRFGALNGDYNLVPRFELTADTRGDRADVPFASSISAGIRVAQTDRLPVQVDAAYFYDWSVRGHGVMASAEKPLSESPNVILGFRFTAFSAGTRPSVLDVWEDDLELNTYMRLELSR